MGNLSERIYNYAKEVNLHGFGVLYYKYVDKDDVQYETALSFFSSVVGNLYNVVYQNGGTSLIACPDDYMKEIGMAYMKIAQIYKASSQDWYVNSVSAENAFYCLARYYKKSGDSSSIPYLIILLKSNKVLLEDKFAQSCKKINSDLFDGPFGRYGSGLAGDTTLSACLRYYDRYVLYYMLTISYDIDKGKILVDDGAFTLLYPDFSDMAINCIKEYLEVDANQFARGREELGKKYFETIYELCEDALRRF